ncbi:MAG: rRNA maturation RNase YbeY [Deltaproteobacteria bacterium]|nr:rRNA maturation RNase YbeY [Deltaproteobacteria bacterium]
MAETALKGLGYLDCEVSILLTDDTGIRGLNKKYRNKDKPTDVLSFPLNDPYMLGDVVISVERARAQAESFEVTEGLEVGRLLAHGILHLIGYDHVKGGRQAKRMREKEEDLMVLLKKSVLA